MNMHKSFRKFLTSKLDVQEHRKESLSKAKNEIRNNLRKYLPVALKQEFNDYTPEFAVPRFRTQGSWSHGTLNMPAYNSQHIDIDDGVYIKIEYIKDKGEPRTCAVRIFNAVQNALIGLCQQKGWSLIRNIDTCVRVDLNNGAHVDIPIYATPETTYQFLEAKKAALTEQGFLQSNELIKDVLNWGMLDNGEVLLAHRQSGWIISDPGPVTKWVKQAEKHHGPLFIPSIRYIKAWRDWQWEQGGPTSICLMVAAERVFTPTDNRDELTLLNTLSALPDMLTHKVPNPANKDEDLAAKLNKNGTRHDVIERMRQFHFNVKQAIASPDQATAIFKNCFGPRFPVIEHFTPEQAVAAVLATPAQKVQSPVVRRTKSGHQSIVRRSHSG